MAGLLDAFTGNAASGRADATIQFALAQQKQQSGALAGYNQSGLDSLNTGYNQAQGQYAQQQGQGLAALGNAYGGARTDLQNGSSAAVGALNPYATQGGAANTMLGNSLGINGAAGNTAATNAFQASPGYEWQVNQALDGAARHANSLGMAYSGNTVDAITRLGQNLANQQYGSWQDRLTGQAGQGQQAATTQAGIMNGQGQSLASLGQQFGQNQGTLYGKGASDLANIDTQNGIAGAGLWSNLGNQTNALSASTLKAVADANKNAGDASQAGSSNLWGSIFGGAKLAAGFF
jgi:hypothetical protein